MVIIRVNSRIPTAQAQSIVQGIHLQAPSGVIVLPAYCELLNEVPADEEIQVLHQDTRVAELEEQLQQQKKRANDLQARLCKCCTYDPPAGTPITLATPACLACENGDMFRPKGGGA